MIVGRLRSASVPRVLSAITLQVGSVVVLHLEGHLAFAQVREDRFGLPVGVLDDRISNHFEVIVLDGH